MRRSSNKADYAVTVWIGDSCKSYKVRVGVALPLCVVVVLVPSRVASFMAIGHVLDTPLISPRVHALRPSCVQVTDCGLGRVSIYTGTITPGRLHLCTVTLLLRQLPCTYVPLRCCYASSPAPTHLCRVVYLRPPVRPLTLRCVLLPAHSHCTCPRTHARTHILLGEAFASLEHLLGELLIRCSF